ncbi:MAG: TonB-dependent receptor [Acidobacteriaceae bacterium]|nr:TonB-dependent receptor [Acidobacteriaceae bacterium]MBV9500611.1 TonB-dependent receptor [Acidobacteriaceae bacterium]
MSILMRPLVLAVLFAIATAPGAPQSTDPKTQPPSGPSTEPPPLQTTVTVNASLASETPASVDVLGQQRIQEIPGTELDDRLRQVPGFSLFRRSSSVVANPTTQGVSLRATGSSGASRTLIFWDGIPLNDPFGGWIYWDRLDPGYIDRVEIDRGASTSVFGDKAMGGTISVFSSPEQPQHLFADYFGGNENTHNISAAYSNLWGAWGLSVHSRDFTTDGYYITPDYARGSVDTRANLQFATGDIHIDYLGASDRLAIHFDVLAEDRNNGTVLTHNSTGLGTIGTTYTHSWTNDQFSFLGFRTQEQFHSTYSSVSPGRNSETLTSKQTVPVQDTGGAVYWRHHAMHWNTIVGADADDTHGISYDYSYITHILTPSGGTLLQHGVFGQADVSVGAMTFFAGIRHQFTGQRGETFVSPNAGAAVGWQNFRFRASGYRSFRAPTLNELYRNFRVGNALTLANPALIPEELVGVETGVDWSRENTRISFTLFHNDLNDLIDNATLRTSPNQILRQRQNFPGALSRGLELGVHHHWLHWSADAGYQYADARLATGQRIPEVPKNSGTAQLTFSAKSTLISGGVRAFSLVFDDDLNQFLLPGYATLNLTAQQHLIKGLSGVISFENLLDRTYLVALTPNPNIGAPRLWRVGLRWSGGIK